RLRLREDFEVHLCGVAKVHRAVSCRTRDAGALRLPGRFEYPTPAQRHAASRSTPADTAAASCRRHEGRSARRQPTHKVLGCTKARARRGTHSPGLVEIGQRREGALVGNPERASKLKEKPCSIAAGLLCVLSAMIRRNNPIPGA